MKVRQTSRVAIATGNMVAIRETYEEYGPQDSDNFTEELIAFGKKGELVTYAKSIFPNLEVVVIEFDSESEDGEEDYVAGEEGGDAYPRIVIRQPQPGEYWEADSFSEPEGWQGEDIENLNISIRVVNVIKNDGIRTLGGLCSLTEERFLKIPLAGRKALREVKIALAKRGLALSPSSA